MDFLRILTEMGPRRPRTVMIENVPGFLTSNGGGDWQTVISGLQELDYSTDHIIVNASAFVPQSRARVFVVAHNGHIQLPDPLENAVVCD